MDDLNFSVRRFGAMGDDATDDTAAIQAAIDAAAEVQGTVWFPPGQYRCGMLQVRTHTALAGSPTWAYRRHGGTVLRLNDPAALCLVNISGTVGARVSGLALDGGSLGEEVHGIYKDDEELGTENSLVIENCRVAEFSGDGAHLEHAWGFTLRDNLFHHNAGDGIMVTYWDGWIHDNIMIGNGKFGLAGRAPSASVTITGNRIEWNVLGGILFEGGNHYNVGNNYIDRSGGPGLTMRTKADDNDPKWPGGVTVITGNIFNRSGARVDQESRESCHILLEGVAGVTCTGNTMCFGNNDDGSGPFSPSNGVVLKNLRSSVVSLNAMHNGATRTLICDEGGHDANTIIRDNVGCVAPGIEN
jgi:hypothetical protein